MNLMNRFIPKKEKLQIHFTDQHLLHRMNERIMTWLPAAPKECVIVCIGTDRSTGDALGPLTGSYLADRKPKHLHVYGTLPNPVHATNMEAYLRDIQKRHENPFMIAVDASLGKTTSVGNIIADIGSLNPGAALNKQLPPIGDIHITGVVNISGFMEHAILQNTRLSLVVDMAKKIAALLENVDQQLIYTKSFPGTWAADDPIYKKEI